MTAERSKMTSDTASGWSLHHTAWVWQHVIRYPNVPLVWSRGP